MGIGGFEGRGSIEVKITIGDGVGMDGEGVGAKNAAMLMTHVAFVTNFQDETLAGLLTKATLLDEALAECNVVGSVIGDITGEIAVLVGVDLADNYG